MSDQPLTKPLENVRVAVTRATHQVEAQRRSLEDQGATVFHYPCIAIAPPQTIDPLDAALERAIAGEYEWLVVTSSNTAFALSERLRTRGLTLADVSTMRVATVGAATAKAVEEWLGLTSAVAPSEFTAEALGAAIPHLSQSRVFLPQSAIADSSLAERIQAQGATVDVVTAYRTVVAQGDGTNEDDVPAMLWEGSIDAITFTSASTVHNFARRLSIERATLAMLDDVCVACIGPSTAAAARQFGLAVDVMPAAHTIQGLTDELIAYFQDAR